MFLLPWAENHSSPSALICVSYPAVVMCVCSCVCLSLKGCLQAKLCRVYHYHLWWLCMIQCQMVIPMSATESQLPVLSIFVWSCVDKVCVFGLVHGSSWSLCTMCAVTNGWSVWECVGGILLQQHVEAIKVGPNYKNTHSSTNIHISGRTAHM